MSADGLYADGQHCSTRKMLMDCTAYPEIKMSGLNLEYTYHPVHPSVEVGPQQIELVLLDTNVQWAYLTNPCFIRNLSRIFSTCFYPDWCSPNPSRDIDQWIHVNIIFRKLSVTVQFPSIREDAGLQGMLSLRQLHGLSEHFWPSLFCAYMQ